MAGEDVENDTRGMNIVRQRLCTGSFYCIDAVRQHGTQDIDYLPVTTGLAFQFALNAPDRCGKDPFLERRSVAQGTGFAC
jgi:hypothetical protein